MKLTIRNAADVLAENVRRKLFAVLVGVILIWFLWGLPCLAQELPTSPQGLTDPQELEAFLDDFFAKEMTKEHVPGAAVALVKDGKIFFSKGYGYADLEKLAAVFGEAPEVPVITGKDGTLSIYVPENKAVEVEPLLFRTLSSDTSMTIRQDERGRITYMFLGDSAFGALEKLAWYETKDFQVKLVVFCTLVFFSACVVGSIGWLIRRTRKPSVKTSKMARLAQFLAVLVSALNLIFLIGLGLVVLNTDFWEFFFGVPPTAIALLFIPPLTTGLTLGLLVFTVQAWKNQYWSAIKRVHYSLITLAALGFVSFLNYWNLLGFRF